MATLKFLRRPTRVGRYTVQVAIVSMLVTSCASTSASGTNATADSSDVASADSGETELPAMSESDATQPDWPTTVATFLTYDLERQTIMDHAGALAYRGEEDPAVEQWRYRCSWVDDQSRLSLDARPQASPQTSAEWDDYIGLVEQYWTTFQQTCQASDEVALAADPTLSSAIWAAHDARLAACDALLIAMEPVPDDAPAAYCEFPINVDIPIESYADLPEDLEDFFATGEVPGGDAAESGPREDLDPTEGPTGDLALLQPGSNTFSWFQPAFTITNDTAWSVEAQADRLFIADGILIDSPSAEPLSFAELMGPGGIADPDQLVLDEDWTSGPIPTIPVPDDLSAWVGAMPLIGTASPLMIGGVDATYWELEYDRSAEGNSVIIYSWQEVDGTLWVDLTTKLHLWHVARPDGSLLFFEQESPNEGPPEREAPRLFENFSFE